MLITQKGVAIPCRCTSSRLNVGCNADQDMLESKIVDLLEYVCVHSARVQGNLSSPHSHDPTKCHGSNDIKCAENNEIILRDLIGIDNIIEAQYIDICKKNIVYCFLCRTNALYKAEPP